MKVKLATALAAGLLAASSFAYAADDNDGKKDMGTERDQQTTGSINTEGRTLSPEERERCMTASPQDASCQGLGGEINQ